MITGEPKLHICFKLVFTMQFFLQLVSQSYSVFGIVMIARSKLELHDAIFLQLRLATFEKETHCKLQKTCYTMQSQAVDKGHLKKVVVQVVSHLVPGKA